MHFTTKGRKDQLIELTKLVTGIRLFNRDCKKGGEGIEDCGFNYFFLRVTVVDVLFL